MPNPAVVSFPGNYDWHALEAEEALKILASHNQGISEEDAKRRLGISGANFLPVSPPVSVLRRFIRQFHNILIYILLGAAVVTACMQHWADTAVIACVILINAFIGFIQENKAEKALLAIRGLLVAYANVIRDGKQYLIAAVDLVPGDIVLLTAGDKVPADLRLTEAHSLRVQEAILTGESLDVEKSSESVEKITSLGDRTCMAYSGTLVTAGQAKGLVIATGIQTEIGRIGLLIGQGEATVTPLQMKLTYFSRWLAVAIISLSITVFLFGYFIRSVSSYDMLMVMIGVAVSSIPEGLPAVISIAMALGARKMAGKNAIIRHLPVIESLGNVTVICTDKTGTLTRNELTVTDIVTRERSFCVTGVGYSAEGQILFDDKEIVLAEHPTVCAIGHAALLNNDASILQKKGIWELAGDPTEGALMAFAYKTGYEPQVEQENWPRVDMIPFSAEARYMATLHHKDEEGRIYVKGAPEVLLRMCHLEQAENGKAQKLDTVYWNGRVNALAGQGKRVLAVAYKFQTTAKRKLHPEHIDHGLTLLGLFGIMDSPREEAKKAIADCLLAGINVKMITGDHVLTASAIGKLLGISDSERVMTGADMEKLSEIALAETAKEINIYARMHPEHKLKLVKALQEKGELVAMTGDGVNDAPALKKADIGIAMGRQGTEVAREASDIILADDNFASIVRAIEEGRNIYYNIRRTIQFMLVTDISEGLTLLLAIFLGITLPITPLQILWVNLITAVTLSLAFVFAPRDPSVMCVSPLSLAGPMFNKRMVISCLGHVGLIAVGTIGFFLYELSRMGNVDFARTMAVNVLVIFQIYYLLALFPKFQLHDGSRIKHYLPIILAGCGVVLLQIALIYMPWMQTVFITYPLEMQDWIKAILFPASILLWFGAQKYFNIFVKN